MKHKEKDRILNVPQMTDEELRRALDFSLGDIVSLHDYAGQMQGVIDGIKLTHGRKQLLYVVRISGEKGIKYLMALSKDLAFVRHSDEQPAENRN